MFIFLKLPTRHAALSMARDPQAPCPSCGCGEWLRNTGTIAEEQRSLLALPWLSRAEGGSLNSAEELYPLQDLCKSYLGSRGGGLCDPTGSMSAGHTAMNKFCLGCVQALSKPGLKNQPCSTGHLVFHRPRMPGA